MTMRQKKSLAGLTLAVALGVLVLVAGGVAARSATQPMRLELVIEEMTFRAPSEGSASTIVDNPTLHARTGQTVEIVLRSLDPGMKHNLVIPELDVKIDAVGYGETAYARFAAPAPGTYTYFCSMHPKLMRGQLVVTE